MEYKKAFETALDKRLVVSLMPSVHRWVGENDIVVGKLLAIEKSDKGKFGVEVNLYTIEGDIGVEILILGRASDEKLEGKLELEKVYAFVYKGKRSIGKGRQVNQFEVMLVPSLDIDKKEKVH
jgi:hypothetical protein